MPKASGPRGRFVESACVIRSSCRWLSLHSSIRSARPQGSGRRSKRKTSCGIRSVRSRSLLSTEGGGGGGPRESTVRARAPNLGVRRRVLATEDGRGKRKGVQSGVRGEGMELGCAGGNVDSAPGDGTGCDGSCKPSSGVAGLTIERWPFEPWVTASRRGCFVLRYLLEHASFPSHSRIP